MPSPSSPARPPAEAVWSAGAASADRDPLVADGRDSAVAVGGWQGFIRLLRRHAGFVTVFGAGLILRVLVLIAYPQAFFYTDTSRYLQYSFAWQPDFVRQAGYSMVLKLLRQSGSLYTVSILQHLCGLAIAVGVYSLLQRRSVPRWLSVLAVTPVLLDALVLSIEHYALAESLFTTLIVGGLLALLWRPRPSVWAAGLGGLLLALSATFRTVSLPLVVITVVYLVVRRSGWRSTLAYAACAALPLLGYATWFHHSYGHYGLSTMQGSFLYGRVAPFADCEKLKLTAAQRQLCPPWPISERNPRGDWYIFSTESPSYNKNVYLQQQFAMAVFTQQPLDTAYAIGKDVSKYLIPNATEPGWVCAQEGYVLPATPPGADYDWCKPNPRQAFDPVGNPATMPTASPLTAALGGYAKVARTPRLVLGLSVLSVLLAMVWRPRRKVGRIPRADILLVATWGLGLLVLGVTGSLFDERYGVPSLAILPAAGALAIHRLWQSRSDQRLAEANGISAG